MQRYFQLIGLMTFLLGLHLLLANLYQPRLLYTQVVAGVTTSAYLLPYLPERLPDIGFSFGVLLIGLLGIYTDIYKPQQDEISSLSEKLSA